MEAQLVSLNVVCVHFYPQGRAEKWPLFTDRSLMLTRIHSSNLKNCVRFQNLFASFVVQRHVVSVYRTACDGKVSSETSADAQTS